MNEHLRNPFNVLYITFVSHKQEVEILVLISVLRVYMDVLQFFLSASLDESRFYIFVNV